MLVFWEEVNEPSRTLKYIKNIYIVDRIKHQNIGNIVFIGIIYGREIIKYIIYAKFVTTNSIIWAVVYLSSPTNQITENSRYM